MNSGRMDQRITLQRQIETGDGAGGTKVAWVNFGKDACPWANVIAKAGKESMDEGRITASFVVLFKIYNRSDVSERDRIVWDGVIYNIRGIRFEGARALYLTIEAERGVMT